MKCKWNLKLHLFDINFIPIYIYIYIYVCIVLCILKSIFSKKKKLKAICKVDVNFNELHVKFNMQSLKSGFH